MARRQSHPRQLGYIPCTYDQAARVGSRTNLLDHFADLIDRFAVPARPRSPLPTIHRPPLALGVGPLVPNRNSVLVEITDIRVAVEKPQEFINDRLEMHLLCRHEREARGQIETHLVTEDAARADAGTVALDDALI